MLPEGGHKINPCRVDAAVPKDIRQKCDVLVCFVEAPGKELAEVVGEYLGCRYLRLAAQGFQHLPDVAAIQRSSAAGAEDDALGDPLLPGIAQQLRPQGTGDQDLPAFALAPHGHDVMLHRLHGEVLQLTDPDAGTAQSLQQQSGSSRGTVQTILASNMAAKLPALG